MILSAFSKDRPLSLRREDVPAVQSRQHQRGLGQTVTDYGINCVSQCNSGLWNHASDVLWRSGSEYIRRCRIQSNENSIVRKEGSALGQDDSKQVFTGCPPFVWRKLVMQLVVNDVDHLKKSALSCDQVPVSFTSGIGAHPQQAMDSFTWISASVAVIVGLIISKLYFVWTTGWCKSDASMAGKTILITGATSGIGKETAKDMARRGGRLILAGRSLSRGNSVALEISREVPTAKVLVKECDLSSLKSVRAFADDVIRSRERIDVLILNAGMVPPPGKFLTEDSLELQFQSNHLGHFLLTNLLLDRLIECSPSRIVIVSSLLHYCGSIDFENLSLEKYTPDPFFNYCNSKLANLLMCKELGRRLSGTGVTANALHPGLVRTEINRQTPWYVKNLMQPISYFWAKSPIEGAQTSIFLAVDPEVNGVSGKYFADCKEAACSEKADDPLLAARLWTVSHILTSQA